MATNFLTGWDDPTYDARNEIVFDGRNKEYGAYLLRKLYSKRVNIAFIIAAAGIAFFVSLPLILELMGNKNTEAVHQQEVEVTLTEPPPVDPADHHHHLSSSTSSCGANYQVYLL